ncbi:MAG: hypothetical protein IJC18_02470, partial [Clostridia bacterium]|nr:hypothetical protein [Clostridia bacterium]
SNSIVARRDLSISYNKTGDFCLDSGDPDAAKEYYEKSLEIRLAIAQESNSIEAYDDLAVSYYKLGTLDNESLDVEALIKAYAIWSKLSEQCPGIPAYAERRDIVKEVLLQ